MKYRVAKKVVARFPQNDDGTLSVFRRRDLVIKAYQKLGLGVPVFQEPEYIPVEPKVSKPRTQTKTTAEVAPTTAVKSLTSKSQDFESLKVGELKALCKEQGIKGYSKLKREGLIELLQKAA